MGLVSVEALQLGCVLIFAFFCHVTSQVGLLLGLRNREAGVAVRFGLPPSRTSKPIPELTGTFSTSALVALIS